MAWDPSDEELDAYILARLRSVGVDLEVLPEEDESAPVDRARVLAAARRLLRESVPVIRDFPIDPQEVPPAFYPSRPSYRTEAGPETHEGAVG